jgi:hypothetical protein
MDALCPRGQMFTSADGKNRPWIKSRLWGKRIRARTSGRRPRMSGRKGHPDGKFYHRMSVYTSLLLGFVYTSLLLGVRKRPARSKAVRSVAESRSQRAHEC